MAREIGLLEYLESEERSDRKHEFFGGEVFEMEAATVDHGRIVRNLLLRVEGALKGSGCETLPATRAATSERGLYT